MSGELTTTDKRMGTVAAQLEKMKPGFAAALQKSVPIEHFIRQAITTIRMNPALLKCKTESLYGALMQAAQLGLDIDNTLGHAYLVPYKDECTLIPGYKGYLKMLFNSGEVEDVYAAVVYEGDEFDYSLGLDKKLHHVPAAGRGTEKIGAYTVVVKKDGSKSFHYMPIAEIYAIRNEYSQTGKSSFSPWKKREDEMIKKTVLRAHCKWLPLSTDNLRRLASHDEYMDGGHHKAVHMEGDEVLLTDADVTYEDMVQEAPAETEPAPSEAPQEDAGAPEPEKKAEKAPAPAKQPPAAKESTVKLTPQQNLLKKLLVYSGMDPEYLKSIIHETTQATAGESLSDINAVRSCSVGRAGKAIGELDKLDPANFGPGPMPMGCEGVPASCQFCDAKGPGDPQCTTGSLAMPCPFGIGMGV